MNAARIVAVRALLIGGVFALATTAAFMREGTPQITFALENGINITIGNHATYNGVPVSGSIWTLKDLVPGADKFFDLPDVKPGDQGESTITVQLDSRGPAWMCLDFSNLQNDDNGVNEPEAAEDPNGAASGELAAGVEFFAWRDDGDNIFEGEQPLFGPTGLPASTALNGTTYPMADATTGEPLEDGSTHYIGMAWCAGDLSVNPVLATLTCNGAVLGNAAQTDSFSVDVAIRAESSRDRGTFTCAQGFVDDGRGVRSDRPERPERPERLPRSPRVQ